MIVLTAAFWWSVEGYTLFEEATSRGQIADGDQRLSVLLDGLPTAGVTGRGSVLQSSGRAVAGFTRFGGDTMRS